MKDEEMAEEYICNGKCQDDITRNYVHCKTCTRIKDFLAGLKAGRPQWHYVKDELPIYNGQFYVALKGHKETFILNYDYNETDNKSWLDDDDTNFDDEVYAWCEKLEAPKEIE